MRAVTAWPSLRLQELFSIEIPIVQAPMAGANLSAMAIAVSEAGGLGSLPCALLSPDRVRDELENVRRHTSRPFNLNFFCHRPPRQDSAVEARWQQRLAPYYVELGLDPLAIEAGPVRTPFDDALCRVVEEHAPPVVSFHFGLPNADLLARVKNAGVKVISSATTVDEARWLEEHGCDAIIAQGLEAGGHRGMFLTSDLETQLGLMVLLPRILDAVRVPVIAAGGIGDARGILAALELGAAGVQIGTIYLFCPEATISIPHRAALLERRGDTVVTNIFSGRPARAIVNRLTREVGALSMLAPDFPLASTAVMPLRTKAEASGSGDFSLLSAGQGYSLGRELGAGALTRALADETLARLADPRAAGSDHLTAP
jgi:nitronate monooxygenase